MRCSAVATAMSGTARRSQPHPWTPDDWRSFYEERAAIREFDGGYARRAAEILAMNETIKLYARVMGVSRETAWRRLERMGI
jgi:hypothetical protein